MMQPACGAELIAAWVPCPSAERKHVIRGLQLGHGRDLCRWIQSYRPSLVLHAWKRVMHPVRGALSVHGRHPLSGFCVHQAEGGWLRRVTAAWQAGKVRNLEYLLFCNLAAGRSFNDLTQWPVFPWVLADYASARLDLADPASFRRGAFLDPKTRLASLRSAGPAKPAKLLPSSCQTCQTCHACHAPAMPAMLLPCLPFLPFTSQLPGRRMSPITL